MIKIFKRFKGCILGGAIGDTNCSIAGQIAGTLLGENEIPEKLKIKLQDLNEYKWIQSVIDNYGKNQNWI